MRVSRPSDGEREADAAAEGPHVGGRVLVRGAHETAGNGADSAKSLTMNSSPLPRNTRGEQPVLAFADVGYIPP